MRRLFGAVVAAALAAQAATENGTGSAVDAANESLGHLRQPCALMEPAGPTNRSARLAWVTHVDSNAKYVIQVGVLFTSLRLTNTTGEFVLLCVKCGLGKDPGLQRLGVRLMDTKLPIQAWEVAAPYRNHPRVRKQTGKKGEGEMRSGLSDFVKLRAHQLVDYERVVFLDADVLVRGNLDHLFWLPEGSHSNGPHAPFNAGLVVIKPRKEDFRHLVAVIREGDYTDQTGWRSEGPCRSPDGCNARHVTQGLWDWFYRVDRPPTPPALTLPRDVYNGLQDEPSEASPDACLVHFTACGKPGRGSCAADVDAPIPDMAVGGRPVSDRYRGLCRASHAEWADRERLYCATYGPPVINVPKMTPGDVQAKAAKAKVKAQAAIQAAPAANNNNNNDPTFPSGNAAGVPRSREKRKPRTIEVAPRYGHNVLAAQILLGIAIAVVAFRAGVLFATAPAPAPAPAPSPPASPATAYDRRRAAASTRSKRRTRDLY